MRRLDSDICIIYEKGVKPIKAKKYYYFENKTVKLAQRYPMSHVNIEPINRGAWRKYNPYNPYVEENEKEENTKIESIDDLFDEIDTPDVTPPPITETSQEEPEAPMLPQDEVKEETMGVDLQKELEAKFDELFGSLEEDLETSKKDGN